MNTIIEYIWLDGNKTPNLRSKLRVIETTKEAHEILFLEEAQEWSFDGSSTKQAVGDNSDCILKPIKLIYNVCSSSISIAHYLVLCEVLNTDGTPHKSNTRAILRDAYKPLEEHEMWIGIEQEYFK